MKKTYKTPKIFVIKAVSSLFLCGSNDKVYNFNYSDAEEDDADEARSKLNSNELWDLDEAD